MNRKNLPVIIMLLAGVIASVVTFLKQVPIHEKLFVVLLVLVIFYVLGCLLENTLNYFDGKNEEKRLEEKRLEEERIAAEEAQKNEAAEGQTKQ